jgi:radical SAM enzyme (TIGR01210 family)
VDKSNIPSVSAVPPEALNKIRRQLHIYLKQLKSGPTTRRAVDKELLSSFEILPGLFRGRVEQRVILALPSRGCSLFHRPQGGCLHCGLFSNEIISQESGKDGIVTRFSKNLDRHEFSEIPVLCIYVPGSFLDDREIDRGIRREIIRRVVQKSNIKKVMIESLPQFITAEKIKELKSMLAGKEIEIAVGLDSGNDHIRKLCINKGFSSKIFEKACALLRQNEINFSVLALLKPPFLTEQESIHDTLQTAEYAFRKGAAAVSVEPNSVQENTFTAKLFRKNLYRPPWLWSIIEVIRQLPPGKEVRVGGIVVYPRPVQVAYNCDRCTGRIQKKLQEYNLIQDRKIFDDLQCTCKNLWRDELNADYSPLTGRIEKILQELRK